MKNLSSYSTVHQVVHLNTVSLLLQVKNFPIAFTKVDLYKRL